MMENEEMIVRESTPLTAHDIKAQVDLIQDVMKSVMRDKEHYGIIPGCGDKPALLKPGAEKLNLTFRMAPDPETEIIDLGGGHREYRVKTIMRSIKTGRTLGAGVGSASTMETKWRYRNAEPEITDKSVPKEYWDMRKNDPNKALDLIGGKGFTTKKVDGSWMIAMLTGEKVEYENPADYYNTCWKMAKKRSLVDGVLTVTAASDIFTQDVDEMVENETIPGTTGNKPPITEPQKKPNGESKSEDPLKLQVTIKDVTVKTGKGQKGEWTLYKITTNEDLIIQTFDTKFGDLAVQEKGTWMPLLLEYQIKEFKGKDGQTVQGKEIASLTRFERDPGLEG